jgi:hypothetical protein
VSCHTVSDALTIAGGVSGLAGAFIVVWQVVGERRNVPNLLKLAEAEPGSVLAMPGKLEPAEERIAYLETQLADLHSDSAELRKEVGHALKEAADARKALKQQGSLLKATFSFVTGNGPLRIIGAILVVLSIAAATAGGVVANDCAVTPSSSTSSTQGAYLDKRSDMASAHTAQKRSYAMVRIRQSYSGRGIAQQ